MTTLNDVRKRESSQRSPDSPTRHSIMNEILPILLRGKKLILLCFVAVLGFTFLYITIAKRVYEANALVLVGDKGNKGSLPFMIDPSATSLNKVTNELETLKSRLLSQNVARILLEKRYLDSTSLKTIPIITADADSSRTGLASIPEIMEELTYAMDFTPIRESDIIRISAQSNDPVEAALLANTYSEAYVERNMSITRAHSRALREFLHSQRDSKKQLLDTTEATLQEYMRRTGTVSLDEETKKIVEQMSLLEGTRAGLDVEITTRRKTLESYREELLRQEPAIAKSVGESNDSYVRLLQEQLARLEVQRDVIIAQNPDLNGQKIYLDKVAEIDRQIVSLRDKLKSRTAVFLKSIVPSSPGESGAGFLAQAKQKVIEQQIELDGLLARNKALSSVIQDYEKQFNRIPEKSIELARLQRARLSSEKLFLLVEEKFNEAAISEKSEFGFVEIIDPATVPLRPKSPRVILSVILGCLLGLGSGVGLVVLRDRLNPRLRTPEDLKRNGLTLLSTVGKMNSIPHRTNGEMGGDTRFDPRLITHHNPLSPSAESYRRLRTNLKVDLAADGRHSFIVTSANSGEGKSTTVANLAIAFAQTEMKVLLVDADLRRPTLHALFGVTRGPGLTDYLLQKKKLDEIVWEGVVPNLDMMCCGSKIANPSEIPGSARMKDFVEAMKDSYDVVLFDTPPILAVADAAALSAITEGTMLVVSSGVTSIPAIDRAKEALDSVGGSLKGVILNKFEPAEAYGGYSPRRSQGYNYTVSEYTPATSRPASNVVRRRP